jgi:DNA-binding transcriptional LysR family regulator
LDSSKSNGPLADLDRQRLRIRLHVSLAVRWLPANLTDFYRRDPDTSQSSETVATGVVEPSCDPDRPEAVRGGADSALRPSRPGPDCP